MIEPEATDSEEEEDHQQQQQAQRKPLDTDRKKEQLAKKHPLLSFTFKDASSPTRPCKIECAIRDNSSRSI
jgi:hypothetical protein